MSKPLVLYSATTKLAYWIAQKYYGETHYVWCAPKRDTDRFGFTNPPSSEPVSIYWTYKRDVDSGDGHSAIVEGNRRGIIRGATIKEQSGVIDQSTRELIEQMVKSAGLGDFSPLLLVIPYSAVESSVRPADIPNRARATSDEYIIESLPRNCFDVLELHA